MNLKQIAKFSLIATILTSQSLFASINNYQKKDTENKIIKQVKNNSMSFLKTLQKERNQIKKILINLNHMDILFQKKEYNKIQKEINNIINQINVLLKNRSVPKVFPIGARSIEYRYTGKTQNINKYFKIAKINFKERNMVATRTILDNLRDEIDTDIFYIPLQAYKKSLRIALKYLKEKKYTIARSIIRNTSRIVYIKQQVNPVTIIVGNFYIQKARELQKVNLNKSLENIKFAKQAFKRAFLLGYIPNKNLYAQILNDISKFETELKTNKKINLKTYKNYLNNLKKIRIILDASSDFVYITKHSKIN